MTVQDYLLKFRKISSLESLEKLYDHLNYTLTDDQELNREFLAGRAEREEEFQMLWRTFCRTIAIEERRNPRCQQTLLPCRFRPHMNEFQTAGENNR